MEVLSFFKRKLRYFRHSALLQLSASLLLFPSVPKSFVSPETQSNLLVDLKQFRTNFRSKTSYSISSTHVSSQSSHFYGCDCCGSVFSANGLTSLSSMKYSFHQSSLLMCTSEYNNIYRSQSLKGSLSKPHNHVVIRCFSAPSSRVSPVKDLVMDGFRPHATPEQVAEVIGLIRSGANLDSELNSGKVRLSPALISEIFRVLSLEKVSALRFFNWIRYSQPELFQNSDICNLVIDNCGRRNDFEMMHKLFCDFSLREVCLTEKAFKFLLVMISSDASVRNSVCKVVEVLNQVGGSCRVSGISSLIEMFSKLGYFEMAKYVIQQTEKKASYYLVLVSEMCRRCELGALKDLLDEMRQIGYGPYTQTYNYIFSYLCKMKRTAEACKFLEEMQESGCSPNALTFEIFIFHSCGLGKLDLALEILGRMELTGIEPRLTTHAAFIKSYFNLQLYEEAYNYVVSSSDKYKCSSNMMYSLLASLYQKKGNLLSAHQVLLEMMKKGLRPNFPVYVRIFKHLQKSGREELARDLKSMFSSLSMQ